MVTHVGTSRSSEIAMAVPGSWLCGAGHSLHTPSPVDIRDSNFRKEREAVNDCAFRCCQAKLLPRTRLIAILRI